MLRKIKEIDREKSQHIYHLVKVFFSSLPIELDIKRNVL